MRLYLLALVWLLTIAGVAFGQVHEREKAGETAHSRKDWEVTCEVFSLPMIEAAALRRENKGSRKIYAELLKRVAGKTAILEEFLVLKTLVTGESEAMSVEDYLYPTHYDPPETPFSMANLHPDHDTSGLRSPSNPWGYESRGLGTTVRVALAGKPSPSAIVIDFEIERTTLLGKNRWGKGNAEALVPRFGVQGLSQRVILKEGSRVFVGTMSPPWDGKPKQRREWFVFAKVAAVMPDEPDSRPSAANEDPGWDVTCEVFSMTRSEAVRLKRESKSDREDYAAVIQASKTGEVKLEEFLFARTAGDGEIHLESVREMSYPEGYEPPDLPITVFDFPKSPEISKALITPATPWNFEIKDVGTKMDAKLVTVDQKTVRLDATLEVVRHLGRNSWGQGPAEAEMPRFTRQRLVSQAEVDLDSPTLLGLLSPPGSLQSEEREKRVWVAFATISRTEE